MKRAEAKELLAGDKATEESAGVSGADFDRFSDKDEIHTMSNDSNESFIVPTEQILQIERKMIRRGNTIFVGLAALLFLLWLWDSMQYIITLLFAVICLLALAVFMPIQFLRFNRNKERLPEKILIGTDGLWIDNRCINFYSIREVEITSMKLRTNAFHPLQRFLYIETDAERRGYWLGSTLSLPDGEYAKLCNMLESACRNKSVPFSYSMKKSYIR
jgi:hypothetical protein